MKINLKKNNKTIVEDIEVELGNITVFAGENNSGKTQIINAIAEELKLDEDNKVVKIPAEKVILENETKNSSKSDEFRKTLEDLIFIKLEKNDIRIENGIEDIDKRLPELFYECNIDNIELKILKGEPEIKAYADACKEVYVKKIIESISIKDILNKKSDIKLSDAGQGTERLVIVSLIRYISEKQETSTECKKYLIIEEPEIFLHPKLKRNFNNSLKKLADNGVKIILTTHDPYFISLNEKEKIYRVYRGEEDGSTKLKLCGIERKLDNTYHSEINYQIFGVSTVEYALLLYSELDELGSKLGRKIIEENFKLENSNIVSLRDFRNQLAHPFRKLMYGVDQKDENGNPVIQPEDVKSEINLEYFILACRDFIK